jgi:1-acyl-sn-glycerol-3-phosphate acyltransferase
VIRTVLWYFFFWLYQVVSIVLFIPYIILTAAKRTDLQQRFMFLLAHAWGKFVIRAAGGRVRVQGLEHLPRENNLCFVANHQGGFDIPIIVGYIPKTIGFIAKKELKYIPILSTWMKAVHCIFINRSNRRESLKTIAQGVEQIRNGHPMVIFPEGTRSQSAVMAPFKSGSLKLPIRSRALIVPVTIDGSYKMKEANGGLMRPAAVTLTIHPAIDASVYRDEDTHLLAEKLWRIINAPLAQR